MQFSIHWFARLALGFACAFVAVGLAASAWSKEPVRDASHSTRRTPPTSLQVQSATKELRQLFADRYRKAASPADKTLFARYLLEQVPRLSESPIQRYAVLQEVRRLAEEVGDVQLAVASIDTMGAHYELDEVRQLGASLFALSKSAPPPQRSLLVRELLRVAKRGLEESRLRGATTLAKLASDLAGRSQDAALRKEAFDFRQQLESRHSQLQQLENAKRTLAKSPDDPDANLIVGLDECLRKRWSTGLGHLSRSGDARLQAAARADLASPAHWTGQLAVADAWREIGAQGGPAVFLERSRHWYQSALPHANPLGRVKIEDRIAELTPGEADIAADGGAVSVVDTPGRVRPDGARVDLASLRPTAQLSGHSDTIWTVAFHPQRPLLATAGSDQRILLWDLSKGPPTSPMRTLSGHSDLVYSLDFDTDGRRLASGSKDKSVRVWDWERAKSQVLATHDSEVRAVAFGAKDVLATASADRTVRIIQPSTGLAQTLTGHTNIVYGVTWFDESTLISGGLDKTVRRWGSGSQNLEMGEIVHAVCVGADGWIGMGLENHQAELLNVAKSQRVKLVGHQGRVFDLAFAPQGDIVATASNDRTVRLWSVPEGRQLGMLSGHRDEVKCLAFSADGKWLATGGKDRSVLLWQLKVD